MSDKHPSTLMGTKNSVEKNLREEIARLRGALDNRDTRIRVLENSETRLKEALAFMDAEASALAKAVNAQCTAQPVAQEPVAIKLEDLRPIWKANGGKWHGPKVEHWSIPEANVVAFFSEAAMYFIGMSGLYSAHPATPAPVEAGLELQKLLLLGRRFRAGGTTRRETWSNGCSNT